MLVQCGDNRFELIEKYKQKLIKSTNIETSKQEMEVIDDILFRFWQMGWLDKLEKYNQLEKAFDIACSMVEDELLSKDGIKKQIMEQVESELKNG